MFRSPVRIWLCFIVLFAVYCPAARAQAAGEDWTRIAVLGAETLCVEPSPDYDADGTVFAGTRSAGIWRSQDYGNTWTRSTVSILLKRRSVAAIAVSPDFQSDGIVLALTLDGRIFMSTNAGGVFTFTYRASIGGTGTALAISPDYSADGIVFAAGDGPGLHISTNGGTTWSAETGQNAPDAVLALEISPSFGTDQTLYVGGSGSYGPMHLRVGLTTSGVWTAAYSGLGEGKNERVTALEAFTGGKLWAGTAEHGMWTSDDGGGSWGGCWDGDDSPANPLPEVCAIAYSPVGGTLLLEGRNDVLHESTDGGTTASESPPRIPVADLAFEPGYDGVTRCHVYVATPTGLFLKTCPVPMGASGLRAIDAVDVALADGGYGYFMASLNGGLFKSIDGRVMVQYNNFLTSEPLLPGERVPEIAALEMNPAYDERGACGTDEAMLFVAANFPDAPEYNGVFKSVDFGNTWARLEDGPAWPTLPVQMVDLAISPNYGEGTADETLFLATDNGLFRWDGGTSYWTELKRGILSVNADIVAVPPTFDRTQSPAFPYHVFFFGDISGLWYWDNDSGDFVKTSHPAPLAGDRITGVAFPAHFGLTSQPTDLFVSSTDKHVFHSSDAPPWITWAPRTTGLPSEAVLDIAGAPGLLDTTDRLICAAESGVYVTTTAGASWTASGTQEALSVAFDRSSVSGQYCMAGYAAEGASLSDTSGASFSDDFIGYNSLPEDVWNLVPHPQVSQVLFASSPTMGVFQSIDGGVSFHPWNDGAGGAEPCVLTSGLGLATVPDRTGTAPAYDVVWAGTDGGGIVRRRIDVTPGAPPAIDLFVENWSYCHENGTADDLDTGRFERFDYLGSGEAYPVWASSPDRGMWQLPETFYFTFFEQNAGLPGAGLDSSSVRFGYGSAEETPLASGAPAFGSTGQGEWDLYTIDVPPGSTDLHCLLADLGSSDPDLYVRFGGVPDLFTYDFRPDSHPGDEEICTLFQYFAPYPATPNSGWWHLDDVRVTAAMPLEGTWHLGIYGHGAGASDYEVTATVDSGCTPSTLALPEAERDGRASASHAGRRAFPGPRAPSASASWGTVSGSGVWKGTASKKAGGGPAATTWVECNGTSPTHLTNLDAQTIAQINDLTLIVGCNGDVFTSPGGECESIWIPVDPSDIAGTCSYDFRDLLYMDPDLGGGNGDVLIAANGSLNGGVWLSGDEGRHWMKISQGFDASRRNLEDLVVDGNDPPSYYAATDETGAYTRTITADPYPAVLAVVPDGGGAGTPVTVTGTGFSDSCPTGVPGDCPDAAPVILFGEEEAATAWVSDTELSASVPAGLTPGTYAVTVRNPDTRRSPGGPAFTVPCHAPSGLANNTADDEDAYADTGVDLTWTDPGDWGDQGEGTRTFEVYRDGSPLAEGLLDTAHSYTDESGVNGITYDYSIRAVNGCGLASETLGVSAADQVLPLEEVPADSVQWTGEATLTWEASAGADVYRVYRGDTAAVADLPSGADVCRAFEGAPLAAVFAAEPASGGYYWYLVAGVNTDSGEGPLGASRSVISSGDCPSP